MNSTTLLASTMLTAGDTLFNGGTLTFYSGPIPTTPETAVSGSNTALITFTFSATAFSGATLTGAYEQQLAAFVSATQTPAAAANGLVVTFARGAKSDGTTLLADYTVGTSGTDVVIGNTTLQSGVPVTINSFYNRIPAS